MTNPHILVIDDEPQILRALRTILTVHKYRVTVAQTGEDGLGLAAAEQPDIIILDLGLPDIDGTPSAPACGSGPSPAPWSWKRVIA